MKKTTKTREKKTIGAAKSMVVPPYHSIVMPCKSGCRVAQGFQPRPSMLTTIITWPAPNREREQSML
jgi:hypothetical protein